MVGPAWPKSLDQYNPKNDSGKGIRRTVRLLGVAETLCPTLPIGMAAEHECTVDAVLDAEAFAATREEGRAMTPEQAVAYALKQEASLQ